MRIETKKIILFVIFVLCIALVAVALFNIDKLFGDNEDGYWGSATNHEKEMNTVYIDGEAYLPKSGVKNYLIIGVDKFGEVGDGGVAQADFIAVLSFNAKNNEYTVFPINRDTMTEVDVLDVFGNKSGTRMEQIALAHAYGSPFEISNSQKCKNTAKAVSGLLHGVKFYSYFSLTMDAIKELVDFVGGVSIVVDSDMTSVDERLVEGDQVLLDGELALSYIRARGQLNDSSNVARMKRQEIFLKGLIRSISNANLDDKAWATCYSRVSPYITTNAGMELIDELNDILSSDNVGKMISLEGESVVGSQYMEFYVDSEALKKTVIDVFYEKAD